MGGVLTAAPKGPQKFSIHAPDNRSLQSHSAPGNFINCVFREEQDRMARVISPNPLIVHECCPGRGAHLEGKWLVSGPSGYPPIYDKEIRSWHPRAGGMWASLCIPNATLISAQRLSLGPAVKMWDLDADKHLPQRRFKSGGSSCFWLGCCVADVLVVPPCALTCFNKGVDDAERAALKLSP